MKNLLQELYEGDRRTARWFRTGLLAFDILTISYFLFTATAELDASLLALDLVIGVVILADVVARVWIAPKRLRFLLSLTTISDLIVLASLFAPLITGSNLGFLRVLRMLRLVRSFRLVERLDDLTKDIPINTRVLLAAANLVTFIFVVTSVIWVWEHGRNAEMKTYVDALYFTITTLTTTGYGDITLTDQTGRLLTIGVMIFGVGFFLNLLQAIYRPSKVQHPCPHCGLSLHDHDASHCKHCGSVIYIETKGQT
ncbi:MULTISPECIES: ion transporter [Roseobacteraceae]|uniref:Voltage-gated potassium channel Kch n=1 Tax=Pseudosulfitobacter pseudonitzschiae TaxID=1402135 RepID=A0A221JWI0_9RHOB|nr:MULTISPECIES: ion transporter [Roseobacteraceae]ASM71053.1 voltage-gated potassium channel Kch [Pseudosulfitobacter pseudonitzschiae]